MLTPVFNFAIARNVQTISPDADSAFAIRLPAELQAATHYLNDLPRMSFARIRVALEARAIQFSDEFNLRELQQSFVAQLDLHREVHQERHRATLEHLPAAFDAIAPSSLSDQQQIRLWDNLVHFLWIVPDEDIVETIRAILVAEHIRRVAAPVLRGGAPDDPEHSTLVRRAMRARVVLPVGVDNRVPPTTAEPLSAIQSRLLRNAHSEIGDKQRIETLTAFRAELHAALIVARPVPSNTPPDDATPPTPRPTAAGALIAARPAGTVMAQPRPRFALNALNLSPRSDLPVAMARLTAPDTDADDALLDLDDELDALTAEAEDRGEAETEDEQVFFLHGAEIAVTERIPAGAFMISADEVTDGFHLVMSYFHDAGDAPELSRVTGQISTSSGAQAISAEPISSGKPGYQFFRLTSEPLQAARFELSLDFSPITGDQRATIENLVLHDVGDSSGIAPWTGPQDLVANPPPLFGVNKIGVLDFHRVEEELHCFEASEPSHIENLLARQHKERMTRRFTMSEVETERTREAGFEREDDLTTTDRFEQQSTVEEVLAEERSRNINVNAGVSGGFGKSVQMYANTAVTFANATSREESRADALTFARDVTSRVAQKVTSKTTERRRTLVQRQYEEVTRHGLDNRAGDQHVVGIYRFLDKVYRNHLVNYGRRCVVEWMIPDPSINYIRAQELALPKDDFNRRPPKRPGKLGMRRPSSVTPKNYRKFGKAYGVDDLPAPPPFIMYISRSFAENNPPASPPEEGEEPFDPGAQAVSYEIEIPEDYLATHYAYSYETGSSQTGGGGGTNGMQPFDVPLSYSVPFQSIENFPMALTMTIRLTIRRVVQRDWQYQVYTRVMAAYREKKAEYDAAKEAYEDGGHEADLNPRFKKDIIQRELRRVALYMIQKPHDTDVTHDHYMPAEKGKLHTLKLTGKLDRHAERVRFFEQCFEWDLMAYLLYPYFYADEKKWSVKLAMEETRNRDFAAFLASGMARLVVPIRPGFEDAVSHYLQTGEVWFGRGLVMDVENDLYLSIAEEMASGSEETEILDTWLTKIPTNLNIIQQDAAAIVGDGLPCLDEEGDGPIATGSSRLAPVITAASEPDG